MEQVIDNISLLRMMTLELVSRTKWTSVCIPARYRQEANLLEKELLQKLHALQDVQPLKHTTRSCFECAKCLALIVPSRALRRSRGRPTTSSTSR
jgi:hypothetical protein